MLGMILLTPILWTGIVQVSIEGFAFVPDSVHVQAGDTVRWTQNDATTHTSTGLGTGAGAWTSGNLSMDQTYQRVFGTVGSFDYRCDIHRDMLGKVTVSAATALRAPEKGMPEGAKAAETNGTLRDLRGRSVDPAKLPATGAPSFQAR